MGMDVFVVAVTAACGVVGALSVIGAVHWSGGNRAIWFQRLFIVCLVSLGACTLFAVGEERTCWILGAAVFGTLCVVATVDYSAVRAARAARAGAALHDGQNETNFAGWQQ